MEAMLDKSTIFIHTYCLSNMQSYYLMMKKEELTTALHFIYSESSQMVITYHTN